MSIRSLLFLACCSLAAAEWTFSGGKAIIAKRGDPEGSSTSFEPNKPLTSPISLGPRDVLKLQFTLKDGDTPNRPHQAFLLVRDPKTELETFFPLAVKGASGKAKVDLSQKNIPAHLIVPELDLSLVLGSFGTAAPPSSDSSPAAPTTPTPGSLIPIGKVAPVVDASAKVALEKQRAKDLGDGNVVYGPKPEIRHVFRDDPKSPPIAITLVFLLAVLAGYVGLFGAWFPVLGANLGHLPKALQAAPLSHPLFLASLVSLEGLFFLYYTSWNLFQTLAGVGAVGITAFLSGSRALREVRARRERGER